MNFSKKNHEHHLAIKTKVSKLKAIFLIFLLTSVFSFSQVGINTTNPQAELDIRSSNQAMPSNTDGILIPRIDEFPVTNPTASKDGMLVFVTGNGIPIKGFYYWDNAVVNWILINSNSSNDHDWYEEGSTNAPDNINDDIFTQGNVAIGKNTADWSLEIEEPNGGRGISILMNGTSNTAAYGLFSEINNSGSGNHYGTYTSLDGTNASHHYGSYNDISGTSSNGSYGVYNNLTASGNPLTVGMSNVFTSGDSVLRKGVFNDLRGGESITQYGVHNLFASTVSGADDIGVFNELNGTGFGNMYGTNQIITNSGSGNHYGIYNNLIGSGSGDKFGSYNLINSTAGGTHYGIYSSVLKPGSYAGYFLGNVSIGTTTSNNYILPVTRGTNGQVMQIDGSGIVTWEDISATGAQRINDLIDGKSDNDGTDDGSSIFLGIGSGINDNGADNKNVGVGFETLNSNIDGINNVAIGYQALYTNSDGVGNIAHGDESLFSNVNGTSNIGIGTNSLHDNLSGSRNIALGLGSLGTNIDGNNNITLGAYSLNSNQSGHNNIVIGVESGQGILGNNNIMLGYQAGSMESGSNKLYIESSDANADNALIYGDFGIDNTSVGNLLRTNSQFQIGNPATTGYEFPTTDGTANQSLQTDGSGSLTWQTIASPWVDSGTDVTYSNVAVENNLISINNQRINGTATSLRFGSTVGTHIGIFTNSTELGVVNNGAASLGSNAFRWNEIWSVNPLNTTSDKRLKKDIKDLNYGLKSVLSLKPVSYKWKSGKQDTKIGFLAQDVEQVIPEIVSHIEISKEEKKQYKLEGRKIQLDDTYALRYTELIPVLVKAIQEQQETITHLEKQIQHLETLLTKAIRKQHENLEVKDSYKKYKALLTRIENIEAKMSN